MEKKNTDWVGVGRYSSVLPPADLTGHPPLHLDDIRGAGEAETPQHSLPALELVHLQDSSGLLQLSLGCPDLGGDLNNRQINGINHHVGVFWVVFATPVVRVCVMSPPADSVTTLPARRRFRSFMTKSSRHSNSSKTVHLSRLPPEQTPRSRLSINCWLRIESMKINKLQLIDQLKY